jgi:hypothetical protein
LKICIDCNEEKDESLFFEKKQKKHPRVCRQCYNTTKAIKDRARRRKKKQKALDYKGGSCQMCGYDQCIPALEFHHRDPKEKDLEWKGLQNKPWHIITIELDKCDLLCCRCHREVHERDKVHERDD